MTMGAHPGPGLCFWVPSSTNLLLRCSPAPAPGSKAEAQPCVKASFVRMYMYVYGYVCGSWTSTPSIFLHFMFSDRVSQ